MAENDPQPDTPILQESRATKTGFLLSDTRLRAFVPTPEGKRMRPSDIWDHGEALSKRGHPGSTWFLCRTCFDSRPSAVKIYDITEATTAAVRHLRKSHKLLARTGMKRSSGQMDDFVERVEKHRSAPLGRATFDNAFVSWAVCDSQTHCNGGVSIATLTLCYPRWHSICLPCQPCLRSARGPFPRQVMC